MRDFTNPHNTQASATNPFLDDVFIDDPVNLPGVGRLHHQAFARILESIENLVIHNEHNANLDQCGRTFLITAPRAGYGKSHLIARLRENLGTIASILTLPFDPSRPVTWPVALSSVVRQLSQLQRDPHRDLSAMNEISRFFLSRLILDNLTSGALRPKDCPESPDAIRSDFVTLLSPSGGSKLLNWTDRKAVDLAKQAGPEFSRHLGITSSELGFWTRIFTDFCLDESGSFEPLRGLSNGEARERLLQLLRIATAHRPILLFADGLDGFFDSATAGMEIAEIVTGIREHVARSVAMICLNEDVWQSTFENKLPSAWIDRFAGEATKLRNMTPEAAGDLILMRLKRTRISEANSRKFVKTLQEQNLWIDAETKLYPRAVLRQARSLWAEMSAELLKESTVTDAFPGGGGDDEFSTLTDKSDFFKKLQSDKNVDSRPPAEMQSAPPQPASMNGNSAGESDRPPLAENPFFSQNDHNAPGREDPGLAGIDSIINDIRGSGNTVTSEESAQAKQPEEAGQPPEHPPVGNAFQAGPIQVTPQATASPAPPQKAVSQTAFQPPQEPTPAQQNPQFQTPPVTAPPSVEALLQRRQEQLLQSPPLRMDLERIERFVSAIGKDHPGLSQQEERYPSSRTVCLRWTVRDLSVLIGFESPRNVYFWNNLLQRSLASNRNEKIAAFSHSTERFNPSLFSTFGFSPAVIKGKIDVIELSDRELALVYAAESVLQETRQTAQNGHALQVTMQTLDPLWRRISQSL